MREHRIANRATAAAPERVAATAGGAPRSGDGQPTRQPPTFAGQDPKCSAEPRTQELVSEAGHLWKVRASSGAEMDQLRIRVIALESLVVSLLAHASERQRKLAREMAAYIRPRPGFTAHRPTLHAATRMLGMVDRADHLRAVTPASDRVAQVQVEPGLEEKPGEPDRLHR